MRKYASGWEAMGITREVGIIPVERSSGGSRTSIRICSGFAVAEVICEIRGGWLVGLGKGWMSVEGDIRLRSCRILFLG